MKRVFLIFTLMLFFNSSAFATVVCDVSKTCFLNIKGGQSTHVTFFNIAKKHTYACSFHANMNPKITVSNVRTPLGGGMTVILGNNNDFTIYTSYSSAPLSDMSAIVTNDGGDPRFASNISLSCGKF